jgi:hypothetical protein
MTGLLQLVRKLEARLEADVESKDVDARPLLDSPLSDEAAN